MHARFVVPVLYGPLRGAWWSPSSGGKTLRVLLGSYEPRQTLRIAHSLTPGAVFYDIGAHVGYYSLLAAKYVTRRGRVRAFEPFPQNAAFLRRHVQANRLDHVTAFEFALADVAGEQCFTTDRGSGTGSLCEQSALRVQVRTLDDVAAELGERPTHVKIDVEGAELAVLHGGERTLRQARPELFLSTHGNAMHVACCDLLQSWGYELDPLDAPALADATEIVAVPAEHRAARSAA